LEDLDLVEKRALHNTQLEVSRACLGTMTFGSQTDEATAFAMVDYGLDAGVNFFDTADVYNAGRSEEILGKALGGRRQAVVLASKVGGVAVGTEVPDRLSRGSIVGAVEASLRRLNTEYLDIYYLHVPDRSVPLEETLEAMDQLIRQGKIRYAGASNYASWQICRMHWLAERHGYPPMGVTQVAYSLLARGIEQEYLPMCSELGVSVVAYNPLAGGLLTGKHPPQAPLPGTRFERNRSYLDRYWKEGNLRAVQRLAGVAEAAGRSPVALALNWLLYHTPIDCVVLGASRLEQLRENLTALEQGALPPDLISACDQVCADLHGTMPPYNR
jgi:aryl-alcohol dehydrogenase-like predicted oxidoreductase